MLGLHRDEMAWARRHTLRRAMVRSGREPWAVRGGDLDVRGVEQGGGKRPLGPTQALVAVTAEVRGQGIGRIRLQRIPKASGERLAGFVQTVVAQDAIVIPDGWTASPGLTEAGDRHRPRVVRTSGQMASDRGSIGSPPR